VPGARVELRPPGWQTLANPVAAQTTADGDGQFVLENPPVGEFTVVGVFPDGEMDEGGWPQVIIEPDQSITGLAVPMERALPLRAPADGEVVGLTPTLSWEPFAEATRYRVMVIDAGTTAMVADQTIEPAELRLDAPLLPGASYQWVVNALAADGTLVASGHRTFTVDPNAAAGAQACAPQAGELAFDSQAGGYCFAYPGTFTLGEAVGGPAARVLGPALDASADPLRATLEMEVTPLAAGATLATADDEFVGGFGSLAEGIAREPFTLGGEPAEVLDNVPARLTARVVLAVRGGKLYALWFQPADMPAAQADFDLLFETVTRTFAFVD
jgi:hypothetical protein